MAIITVIAAADMGRVFARGGAAIVAGTTATDHLRVINRGRGNPQRVAVAIFANIGGLDVSRCLAGGSGAVMTINTAADDVDMIEVRR